MALQKETVTINFSQGLDTLDDPNQLAIGGFTSLINSVFIKANTGEVGALKKRNGFIPLPATVSTVSYLTNYNESIVGLGQGSVQRYSQNAGTWNNSGYYQPISLNTKSLIKNSYSQSQQDSTIAYNGIGCVAYNLGDPNSTVNYALFDSSTGQIINGPTVLPVISTTTFAIGQPKTFTLGSSFIICYGTTNGTTSSGITSLLATQVSAVSPFASSTITISNSLFENNGIYTITSASAIFVNGAMFDGTVASGNLILSYLFPTTATGCNIVGANISPSLSVSSATIAVGSYTAAAISTCFDPKTSTIYTTIGSGLSVTYVGTNYNFAQNFSPITAAVSSASVNNISINAYNINWWGVSNIATIASGSFLQSFYQASTYYSQFAYSQSLEIRSDNIIHRTVTSSGVVGSETIIGPDLGLASKPFFMNGSIYLLGASQDLLQPTYFLINSTGSVISQFAYGNGGGYYYYGIPSITINGINISASYLRQDLLVPKNTPTVSSSAVMLLSSPYYSQSGINQITFSFTTSSITAKQAGNVLAANGGFLWTFDGSNIFENNFFLYPNAYGIILTSASGSAISAIGPPLNPQTFQYQVTFESMDAQGNFYRSAPGIGNTLTKPGGAGSVAMELAISMPRLGYRLGQQNPINVSVYRWSQATPIFYKLISFTYTGSAILSSVSSSLYVTSALNGLIGSGKVGLTTDSVVLWDVTPDSNIVGNEILYTSGNVVEDSPSPSFISMDIWDERIWGISAEDGTLWFSKPLVQNAPIEMNVNNFTLYVPPNQTSQGTFQSPLCLAPLDNNQIIFCKSALLYINGTGPDATDANSQYSEPIQIPSQVGCSNPNSIVQTPYGLMFQSDNGIWRLGRDLSVQYVGKEVESFNSVSVTNAICIPGTNEVRFALNNGTRLIYDMLAQQWGEFQIPGVNIQSGTIVNNTDTILSTTGQVYQETQGQYLDGTNPITMGFTTGWINLAGLQGYARAYYLQILASFQSPHTYTMGIAYDYNPAIVQTATINPYNSVGSGSQVEQWQVWFKQQQCQSIQLTFNEISSSTAGAGLIISGMSLTYGRKKTYARNIAPRNRTG